MKSLVKPVLRHRLLQSAEAEMSGQPSEAVIEDVFDSVTPPGSEPEPESDGITVASGGIHPGSDDAR